MGPPLRDDCGGRTNARFLNTFQFTKSGVDRNGPCPDGPPPGNRRGDTLGERQRQIRDVVGTGDASPLVGPTASQVCHTPSALLLEVVNRTRRQ